MNRLASQVERWECVFGGGGRGSDWLMAGVEARRASATRFTVYLLSRLTSFMIHMSALTAFRGPNIYVSKTSAYWGGNTHPHTNTHRKTCIQTHIYAHRDLSLTLWYDIWPQNISVQNIITTTNEWLQHELVCVCVCVLRKLESTLH